MTAYTIRVERSEHTAHGWIPEQSWHGSIADPQGTIHHVYTWTLSGAHRKAKRLSRKLSRQFTTSQYVSVYDYYPDKLDDIGWGP